ncbi:hypothetical protein E2320_011904 [Naja naja]|nr:hypothetical protein E2320_011904 [Naja naja]
MNTQGTSQIECPSLLASWYFKYFQELKGRGGNRFSNLGKAVPMRHAAFTTQAGTENGMD